MLTVYLELEAQNLLIQDPALFSSSPVCPPPLCSNTSGLHSHTACAVPKVGPEYKEDSEGISTTVYSAMSGQD